MSVLDESSLRPIIKNVCFAGPRPVGLPDHGRENSAAMIEAGARLRKAVLRQIAEGKTTFLNGCMAGFDVIAGETVLKMKQEYPFIRCITVAPFRINYFANKNWTPEWKVRALELYIRSDGARSLSETYHKGVYYARNRYMVDHSAALICYYSGAGNGTKYTLDYAGQKQLRIINTAERN